MSHDKNTHSMYYAYKYSQHATQSLLSEEFNLRSIHTHLSQNIKKIFDCHNRPLERSLVYGSLRKEINPILISGLKASQEPATALNL